MIYNDDVVNWAKNYEGEKFHALLCDPPYHLTSIVKRFGGKSSAPAQFGTDGVFSRSSKGFMGQVWDGGDIAFQPETWAAMMPVLYDGAFGMAFSASRNWHRLAVAIEDAGFIIHPTIFGWLNGQGFPKAHRVHKEGEGVFDGHRYSLQALKPAVEPIIVFQKPYSGRPIDNILETGAGTLNIDGSRIPTSDEYVINRFDDGAKPFGDGAGHKYSTIHVPQSNPRNRGGVVGMDLGISNADVDKFQEAQRASVEKANNLGRYPSNFIISEENTVYLDKQSGNLSSGKMTSEHKRHTDGSPNGIYGKFDVDSPLKETIGDSGGASRFFFHVSNQIDEADPIYYCAKVGVKERNAGLDGFEEKVGSADYRPNDDGTNGIQSRLHGATVKGRNPHPTLKPIDLCTYLAKLLLPPAEYTPRRIVVPFSGVASEMIGCYKAGWEEVVGIEFDKENGYIDIAEKRIEYWRNK